MMRRSSFRPRPLNIFKPIQIFCSQENIEFDIEESTLLYSSRGAHENDVNEPVTGKTGANGDDDRNNSYSDAKMRKHIDIPVPIIGTVNTYEEEHVYNWSIPKHYVRFRRDTQEDFDNGCDYELQEEDMVWLNHHPDYSEGTPPILDAPMLQRMIDLLEKLTPDYSADPPSIPEIETVFSMKLNFEVSKVTGAKVTPAKVVSDIRQYWLSKRNKLKKPLLFRFWPQTAITDSNPHRVFRPREKERYKLRKHRKNDGEALHRLKQLKTDFTTALQALDLLRKRERLKRSLLDYMNEVFEQAIYDMVDKSGKPRKDGGLTAPREKIKLKLRFPARSNSIDLGVDEQEDGGIDASSAIDSNTNNQQQSKQLNAQRLLIKKQKKKQKKRLRESLNAATEGGQDGEPMPFDDSTRARQYRRTDTSPWGSPLPSMESHTEGLAPVPIYLGPPQDIVVPSFLDQIDAPGTYSFDDYNEEMSVFPTFSMNTRDIDVSIAHSIVVVTERSVMTFHFAANLLYN